MNLRKTMAILEIPLYLLIIGIISLDISFSKSGNKVIIAGLFAPDKIDLKDRLNPELVVERINSDGGDAYFIPDIEALVNKLTTECRPKDVLLIMSSGGFSGIHQKLITRL